MIHLRDRRCVVESLVENTACWMISLRLRLNRGLLSNLNFAMTLLVLRNPLAAPIGDSWKLDPRWDVFNHFKTLSVIVLFSECVGC